MPNLNQHPQAQERIEEMLLANYNRMIPDGLLDEIRKHLGNVDSALAEEAVLRHIEDTRTDSRGLPIGKYPPSVADLHSQLEQMFLERKRKREAEEARKRKEESDTTYVRAMNSSAWKQELKRGQEIRQAIGRRFSLSFKTPGENRLLQQTLFAVQGDKGLGTVIDAVAIAERFLEDAGGDPEAIPIEQIRYRKAENQRVATQAA